MCIRDRYWSVVFTARLKLEPYGVVMGASLMLRALTGPARTVMGRPVPPVWLPSVTFSVPDPARYPVRVNVAVALRSELTVMPVLNASVEPLTVGGLLPMVLKPVNTSVSVVLSLNGFPNSSTFWIVIEIGDPAVV